MTMMMTPGSLATLCRTWRMTLTPTTNHELLGHDRAQREPES
jgi:hypothetical protein